MDSDTTPRATDQLLQSYDEILAFAVRLNEFARGRPGLRSICFFWKFRKHHRFEKRYKGRKFLVWERAAVDNRRWNQRAAHLRWEKEKKGKRADEYRLFIRSQGSEFLIHGRAMAVRCRFPDVRFGDIAEVHKLFLERAKRDPYTPAFFFLRAIVAALLGGVVFHWFPKLSAYKWIQGLFELALATVLLQTALMLFASIRTFFKSDRLAWAGDVINYLALLETIEEREAGSKGTNL